MTKEVQLCRLRCGESGAVTRVCHEERGMLLRLRDLGFTEGCTVLCVGRSPFGGMSAYLVRGAVIALRDRDAAAVHIRLTVQDIRPVPKTKERHDKKQ